MSGITRISSNCYCPLAASDPTMCWPFTEGAASSTAVVNEQDFLCRVFGDCVAGDLLDLEVDTMVRSAGPLKQKLFRYIRYNAELTRGGLDQLGCTDIEPQQIQKLDSIDTIPALKQVGKAVAERKIQEAHLNLEVFRP